MLNRPDKALRERLAKLESHLENENPLLLDAVQRFRKLDRVAYRMGLLDRDESYATRIPWWPLISVLGTFSAGKSSFINEFLGETVQRTGNQAVDDKFTVMTFAKREGSHVLPGVALDSDPRFPFYQMSEEIDKVSPGEGRRIDAYLQMKTSGSEALRGKILIDSPGFDADDQRNAILRLTDHIIDLSDLVLVFFDARHPEPGAMQDTLEHLVSATIHRSDSEKFLFVLNQIDTAAMEDNPEAVVAAWQRALAARGLTAGRFYTIYNDAAAVPIEDDTVRSRFEARRDRDLADIIQRLHQVEIERSYRIIGSIDNIASSIENDIVPRLRASLQRWQRLVLMGDLAMLSILAMLLYGLSTVVDISMLFTLDFEAEQTLSLLKVLLYTVVLLVVHIGVRRTAAKWVATRLPAQETVGNLRNAFLKSTWILRPFKLTTPSGWGSRSRSALKKVKADVSEMVQTLNDRFTNPSGTGDRRDTAEIVSMVDGRHQDKVSEQKLKP